MTESIEEQCKDYYESLPELESSEFTGETIFRIDQVAGAFIAGAKARDDQWSAVVNELRDTINWCQDQCGYASPWWVKFNETKTKADQMLKEMGMK